MSSSSEAILQDLFRSVRNEKEESSRREKREERRHHRRERDKDRHFHDHHDNEERSYRRRKERRSRRSRQGVDYQEERPPVRNREEDVFWDSKWDALQLQKKAEDQERKGRHYLDERRRDPHQTPPPLKHGRSKKASERRDSSSPECDELKRLKKYKEIQDLVVKEDERYVEKPPDPSLFEWDSLSKMWRRKVEESSTSSSLSSRYRGGGGGRKRKESLSSRRPEEGDIAVKSEEKEEGELRSEEEEDVESEMEAKPRRKERKQHRRHSRSRSRSRHRSRRPSSRPSRRSPPSRHGDHRRWKRSPSRDDYFRSSRSAIDKEKLLAIAKKNAVRLLSSNNLMGMDHNRLVAIKSGGQSLSQLVGFCRELVRKGITDELSDGDIAKQQHHSDSEGETPGLHHPFMIKDRPHPSHPLTFGATSNGSEVLTPAAKMAAKSHRMLEFPVSSGNAHRVKESVLLKETEKEAEEPIEEKSVVEAPSCSEEKEDKEPPSLGLEDQDKEEKSASVSPVPLEKLDDSVFESVEAPILDIGSIVSQRLNAMRKLTENPNDPDAMKEMTSVEKEMSNWAISKNKPGQFTGHTGARVLSKGELCTGIQAWARQEQFSSAQKVCGGFGEFMLRKMGWNQGEGLGKDKSGDVDPLTLDIKMDKKGLMSVEEGLFKRKKGSVLTMTACKDISCKHPVSALMELATKRRWGPPNFVQAFECGPPHKKQYIYKVTVNGVEYQPTIACDNKKKAKSDAATFALQEMGLLAKDPNNPL